jgi:hypothetical protein
MEKGLPPVKKIKKKERNKKRPVYILHVCLENG